MAVFFLIFFYVSAIIVGGELVLSESRAKENSLIPSASSRSRNHGGVWSRIRNGPQSDLFIPALPRATLDRFLNGLFLDEPRAKGNPTRPSKSLPSRPCLPSSSAGWDCGGRPCVYAFPNPLGQNYLETFICTPCYKNNADARLREREMLFALFFALLVLYLQQMPLRSKAAQRMRPCFFIWL